MKNRCCAVKCHLQCKQRLKIIQKLYQFIIFSVKKGQLEHSSHLTLQQCGATGHPSPDCVLWNWKKSVAVFVFSFYQNCISNFHGRTFSITLWVWLWQCTILSQSDVVMTASLDLDLYIAGAILAIFAMELGEHNANKTCI